MSGVRPTRNLDLLSRKQQEKQQQQHQEQQQQSPPPPPLPSQPKQHQQQQRRHSGGHSHPGDSDTQGESIAAAAAAVASCDNEEEMEVEEEVEEEEGEEGEAILTDKDWLLNQGAMSSSSSSLATVVADTKSAGLSEPDPEFGFELSSSPSINFSGCSIDDDLFNISSVIRHDPDTSNNCRPSPDTTTTTTTTATTAPVTTTKPDTTSTTTSVAPNNHDVSNNSTLAASSMAATSPEVPPPVSGRSPIDPSSSITSNASNTLPDSSSVSHITTGTHDTANDITNTTTTTTNNNNNNNNSPTITSSIISNTTTETPNAPTSTKASTPSSSPSSSDTSNITPSPVMDVSVSSSSDDVMSEASSVVVVPETRVTCETPSSSSSPPRQPLASPRDSTSPHSPSTLSPSPSSSSPVISIQGGEGRTLLKSPTTTMTTTTTTTITTTNTTSNSTNDNNSSSSCCSNSSTTNSSSKHNNDNNSSNNNISNGDKNTSSNNNNTSHCCTSSSSSSSSNNNISSNNSNSNSNTTTTTTSTYSKNSSSKNSSSNNSNSKTTTTTTTTTSTCSNNNNNNSSSGNDNNNSNDNNSHSIKDDNNNNNNNNSNNNDNNSKNDNNNNNNNNDSNNSSDKNKNNNNIRTPNGSQDAHKTPKNPKATNTDTNNTTTTTNTTTTAVTTAPKTNTTTTTTTTATEQDSSNVPPVVTAANDDDDDDDGGGDGADAAADDGDGGDGDGGSSAKEENSSSGPPPLLPSPPTPSIDSCCHDNIVPKDQGGKEEGQSQNQDQGEGQHEDGDSVGVGGGGDTNDKPTRQPQASPNSKVTVRQQKPHQHHVTSTMLMNNSTITTITTTGVDNNNHMATTNAANATTTLTGSSPLSGITTITTTMTSGNSSSSNNNNNSSGYNGNNSPPGSQHVVLVHIQPGEIFAVRVGDQVQHISGPATVRMVSNSGPPLPMPMQVAPGHMVQQIVDENGILTNVILAPQIAGMPPGSPITVRCYGGPNSGAQYYGPFNSHYQTQPHPQYNPAHHHGHHGAAAHMHPGVASSPHMHGPPPPSHSCNNLTPSVLPTGPSPPLNSEDRIRQRSWYKKCRKTEEGNYYRQPPRRNKNNKTNNNTLNISVNGDIHHQNNMASPPPSMTNTTNSTTTENGTEIEAERKFFQQISNIPEPQIKEVEVRSASLKLAPPDVDQSEFNMSTVEVELHLSEKGRDKYRAVYSGPFQEINLKNLKPATEYNLRACSRYEEVKGPLTEPISFKTLSCAPDQPGPPKLANKTKNTLLLKWNAACENGSKISTYSLEYDKGLDNGEFHEVYSGLVKQYHVKYLQAGTKYTFRLAAVNGIGKSLFSEPTSFCTSGTVPTQPEPPTLTTSHINFLILTWDKRQNDEMFTLQMEDESTGHGFLAVYNGSSYSCKVPNLQRNTDYRFRLSAKNEEGPSKWSDIVTYQTLPAPPTTPTKLQVKGKIHAHTFKVTWDPPKDTGGTKVFSYHVEMDDGEGYRNIYNGSELECSCDGLTPGNTYNIRVACSGPGGKSDFSDSIPVTTLAVCPGQTQPPKLQGKPKATSLHLRWSAPVCDGGSPITEYIVQMVSPDNTTREVYKGRDTDCAVASLLPGRPYLFQVKCSNKIGAGSWSESCEVVSGPGVPDAPKVPTVTSKSAHCIQLSWEKPLNNGATITEYRLEWQHKPTLDFTQLYVGPHRKYEIKNLHPATNYSFKVSAINSAGASPFSPVCRCQTQASSPAAVVHCKVQTTATDAVLKWEEPHNNGCDILSYNIDTGDKQLINVTDTTEYRLEQLSPDTVYRIKIQAVNAIGAGAFSSAIKVVTKSLPPVPPSLDCVSAAPNCLKLKWGDGRNPDLIQYQLEIGRDDKHFQTVYYGSAHVYKVNRLSELTSYDFRIFAINDAGCGEYSDLYTFTTTKAPPPPLRVAKVSEMTVNGCHVEWQGCKSMGTDSVVYQLQMLCSSQREHDYKSVYRGTDTCFTLHNLMPKCDYQIRVGAIRVCSDGQPEVPGAYSGCTLFSTLAPPEPLVKAVVESRPTTIMKLTKPKALTDQQISLLLLIGFGFLAIVVTWLTQYLLSGEG